MAPKRPSEWTSPSEEISENDEDLPQASTSKRTTQAPKARRKSHLIHAANSQENAFQISESDEEESTRLKSSKPCARTKADASESDASASFLETKKSQANAGAGAEASESDASASFLDNLDRHRRKSAAKYHREPTPVKQVAKRSAEPSGSRSSTRLRGHTSQMTLVQPDTTDEEQAYSDRGEYDDEEPFTPAARASAHFKSRATAGGNKQSARVSSSIANKKSRTTSNSAIKKRTTKNVDAFLGALGLTPTTSSDEDDENWAKLGSSRGKAANKKQRSAQILATGTRSGAGKNKGKAAEVVDLLSDSSGEDDAADKAPPPARINKRKPAVAQRRAPTPDLTKPKSPPRKPRSVKLARRPSRSVSPPPQPAAAASKGKQKRVALDSDEEQRDESDDGMDRSPSLVKSKRRLEELRERRKKKQGGLRRPETPPSTASASDPDDFFAADDEEIERISDESEGDDELVYHRERNSHRQDVRAELKAGNRDFFMGSRIPVEEMWHDYLNLVLMRLLDLSVPEDLQEKYHRSRAQLKSRYYTAVTTGDTVAFRKQFRWYLQNMRDLKKASIGDWELEERIGCDACKSQRLPCPWRIHLSNPVPVRERRRSWLSDEEEEEEDELDDEDDMADERSSGAESLGEVVYDEMEQFDSIRFKIGKTCISKAIVVHNLYHWEYEVRQSIQADERYQRLRKRVRSGTKELNGKDIEVVVLASLESLKQRFEERTGDAAMVHFHSR